LDLHDVNPADLIGTLDVGLDVPHLPFRDDVASKVYLHHTLEHLHDADNVLTELCRITEPGGQIRIRVPYYNSLNAAADPTHTPVVDRMTEHFFTYYEDNVLAYETGDATLEIDHITLVYRHRGLVQRLLPRFLKRMLRHEIGNLVEEMRVERTVVE